MLLTTVFQFTSAQAQITSALDLPVGNGERQVGVERVPNEECRGPTTISPASDGRVAVLDSVNQKILVVDEMQVSEIKLPADLLDPVDLIATESGYVVAGALGDVVLVSPQSEVTARASTTYDPELGSPRFVVKSENQLSLENLAGDQVPVVIENKLLGTFIDQGQIAAASYSFKLEKPTLAVGNSALSTRGFKQTTVASQRRLVDVRMVWATSDHGALIASQETVKAPEEMSFVRLIATDAEGTPITEAYVPELAYSCNTRRPFARLTNGVIVSLLFTKDGKVTVEPLALSKVGTATPLAITRPSDITLIASERDALDRLEQLNGTSAVGLVALQQVTRQSVLKMAREALELRWVMQAKNYSRAEVQNLCSPTANIWHRPPRLNGMLEKTVTGIPYRWGGYASSLNTFKKHLEDGRLAGSDCTCRNGNCVYPGATGLDCSGFVSYAWQTGTYYTTRSLPDAKVSSPVRWENLQPGDIFNKAGSHVRLLESSTIGPAGRFYTVIESAANASCGGVCRKSYSETELMRSGYKPYARLNITL